MRRNRQWRDIVTKLARGFLSGPDMGSLYIGGPVTPRHVQEWFKHHPVELEAVFKSIQPSDQMAREMARDINALLPDALSSRTASPETGMAAEFFVLSCLNRLGYSALLTLGNRKAVDIVVELPNGLTVTIDVKGLAGTTGWPVDNVSAPSTRHFVVFVCYRDLIADPWEQPEVYVVPFADFSNLVYAAPGGRRLVRVSTLRASWQFYEHAWHRLMAP